VQSAQVFVGLSRIKIALDFRCNAVNVVLGLPGLQIKEVRHCLFGLSFWYPLLFN
jgi:hypothetical protein